MNTFKWLIKREYWEHKGGFFWAPVVAAGIITLLTLGTMVTGLMLSKDSAIHINGNEGFTLSEALAQITEPDKIAFAQGLVHSFPAVAMPLMIALAFVVFFYSLSCLFEDRRDRSILFWKSLPISDQHTVLSKALAALLLAPLISVTVALILAYLWLLTLLSVAALYGVNFFGLVLSNSNFYLTPLKLLSFIPIYALWALPSVGYLMFVSAWAKTKPFLWAVGVPVLGGVILSWINFLTGSPFMLHGYWKIIVGRGLGSVMPGSWLTGIDHAMDNVKTLPGIDQASMYTWQLLGSANLWIGVAIGAVFLFGATRMRRYRDEG